MRQAFRYKEDCAKLGLSTGLEGKRIAIQGFGNVGYHAAHFLSQEDGCKIVAIGAWDCCVATPAGPNIEDLDNHRKATGSVRNYPGGQTLPVDAFWDTECDILIPAALENQVTL